LDFFFHILIFMCIYTILAVSYNLILGNAGLLSIAHAAFCGLGAYSVGILTTTYVLNNLVALILGCLFAGIISLVLAFPAIRVRGDYLIIISFGFQLIIVDIFHNWITLFGGPSGVPGIPPPKILGITIYSLGSFLLLALVLTCISILIIVQIEKSPFGLILRSIKEDEIAVQAVGKNVVKAKTLAMCIGGALAGLAGGILATYISCIDPTMFSLHESIYILTMVILGGTARWQGPLLGAMILVAVPEILRFSNIPDSIAAPMHQALYGAVLMVFIRFRPQGIIARRKL
jgi:branched-chain amino acid transport system permease protein